MRRVVTLGGASGHETTLRAADSRPDNLPQSRSVGEVPVRVQAPGPTIRATSSSRRDDWSAFVGGDGDRSGFAGVPPRSTPSVIAARKVSPREPALEPGPASALGTLAREPYTITIDGETYQRPTTRAECGTQRPCPWVSCRHHALVEVALVGGQRRAPSLRLNAPTSDGGRRRGGRRRGVHNGTAGALVQQWIDEAVELLGSLEATCVLDVIETHPDGLKLRHIGGLLGVTRQALERDAQRISSAIDENDARETLREYL